MGVGADLQVVIMQMLAVCAEGAIVMIGMAVLRVTVGLPAWMTRKVSSFFK